MTGTLGTHTYTYDAASRLTSVNGVAYTWDAWGNLVSDGTFTYAYNAAGRMVRAQSLTATLVYTYNAAGLRVAQSAQSSQSVFSWDWASGVPEMLAQSPNPQSPNRQSLYLVGHDTLGRWDGATWAYYLPDALGSVRQATDGTGAVMSAREWTPYGVEVGAGQAGLGYTGEWWDAGMGLAYLRARWYAPGVGRFARRDPYPGSRRQPQTRNRWSYANGNPMNLVDPTGLYSMREIKEVFKASFYDPNVLDYFGPDRPLEGRWGWLEVLRRAEDGDRLLVSEVLGGCPPDPDWPWVYGPRTVRNAGVFQKTGSELFIGGICHIQAAKEGYKYEIQKSYAIYLSRPELDTYCRPYFERGEICPFPNLSTYWEWKATVFPTRKYMGLRRDPARMDLPRLTANVAALIAPELLEDFGELIGLGIEVVEAGSREDMVGASREVTVFLIRKVGGRVHPYIAIGAEIVDLGDDAVDIMESLGYRWVP